MTLVPPPPNVLGPKYERRQRPRNSQGFRIGRSRGNLARTPDVAVVISLNRFSAPVDDTVTAHPKTQVTSHNTQHSESRVHKKMAKYKKLLSAPRPDILSPWRQLLSIPIPCHVHWTRSYCQSRARTAVICRKPCFRGPTGCIRGRVCSGCSCMRGAQVRRANNPSLKYLRLDLLHKS
jgi:hypothetical protein